MSSIPIRNIPGRLIIITLLLASILLPISGTAKEVQVTAQGLKETETKIRDIANKAIPATVALISADPRAQFGTGSGVIVSEDGLILTAAHVSMGMGDRVTVIFPDGKRATGKVLGMDYSRDSGMIQITDPGKYPFVKTGDSSKLNKNDWCVAVGHAGGFQPERTPPLRLGRIISNNPKAFMRTDSALISGDSGGPLFDIDGKVIGIHSNIGFSLSQNNHVPISTFLQNWDRLKSGDRFGGDDEGALLSNPDRPMIGALLVDLPDLKGAIIEQVQQKSPAARAGLVKGDRIVKAGDFEIENSSALVAAIRKNNPGDTMKLMVNSAGTEKEVSIKLASARKLNAPSSGPGSLKRQPSQRSPGETKKLQEEFNRTMRESIDEGKLKLTEDDFEKFMSPADFNQFMERFKKTLTPEEMETLVRIATPPTPVPVRPDTFDPDKVDQVGEDFFREVLDAFRPSNTRASAATHFVFRGQEWKSLCTVVREDGYAVTKASEIETKNNQKLTVLLSKGKSVPARVVKTYPGYDLALLKLENASGLTAINLDSQMQDIPVGSILSAPGSGPDPVAIGLVSVASRSLTGENKGFLGIGTSYDEKGVRVTMVLDDGAADLAGIRKGDIILKIDDSVCDTPEKLIKQISDKKPGNVVIVQLLREGRGTSLKVKLGSRKKLDEGAPDPNGKMNRMGTEVSEQSSGFPNALQTDLPLLPQQCGGPLVDLDGNVIGINIARAGRIKAYAIPTGDVQKLVTPDLPKLAKVAP